VPTVTPITISYDVGYRRALAERPGPADLALYDSEFWDDREGGEALVSARMVTMGPYSLDVKSVKLIRHVSSETWYISP
jgi:trafficking protein particle complex subunit 11